MSFSKVIKAFFSKRKIDTFAHENEIAQDKACVALTYDKAIISKKFDLPKRSVETNPIKIQFTIIEI